MDSVALKGSPRLGKPVLGWSTFGPILAIHFLGTLGFSLAIPFLVFIVADLGGASWTYGLVGATYSAFQLCGAPVLGRWSDRTGRRPVLIASQVGTLVAWLLFLAALSIPVQPLFEVAGAAVTVPLLLVFAARALDGATGGNISVANAYVADLTQDDPEVRQVAFGRMGMAASLGFVVGPAAAGLLAGSSWGPRLPIGIAALVAGLTTIAIFSFLQEPQGRCSKGPPEPGSLAAGLSQQAKPCHKKPPRRAVRKSLVHRPTLVILAATFLLFLGFNLFYASFPVHAAEVYGWSTDQLGRFFALMAMVMFAAQGPLLSFVSPRLGRKSTFALGAAFLALSLFNYYVAEGVLRYLGAVFFAVGNGLAWPIFQARVAEIGGTDQGVVQGAVTSASSLASIVGLIIGGLLYPLLGGKLFLAAAALFLFVLCLTPLWFGNLRQKSETTK